MQEVSTFNPHQSVYDDFSVRWGDDLLDYHRTVHGEIGGAISVFDATQDVEMVPAYGACFITSGGTLSAAGWDRIASECVAAIAAAPPVDGVYFCMHGDGSTERTRPGGLAALPGTGNSWRIDPNCDVSGPARNSYRADGKAQRRNCGIPYLPTRRFF